MQFHDTQQNIAKQSWSILQVKCEQVELRGQVYLIKWDTFKPVGPTSEP